MRFTVVFGDFIHSLKGRGNLYIVNYRFRIATKCALDVELGDAACSTKNNEK